MPDLIRHPGRLLGDGSRVKPGMTEADKPCVHVMPDSIRHPHRIVMPDLIRHPLRAVMPNMIGIHFALSCRA